MSEKNEQVVESMNEVIGALVNAELHASNLELDSFPISELVEYYAEIQSEVEAGTELLKAEARTKKEYEARQRTGIRLSQEELLFLSENILARMTELGNTIATSKEMREAKETDLNRLQAINSVILSEFERPQERENLVSFNEPTDILEHLRQLLNLDSLEYDELGGGLEGFYFEIPGNQSLVIGWASGYVGYNISQHDKDGNVTNASIESGEITDTIKNPSALDEAEYIYNLIKTYNIEIEGGE